MHLWARGLRAAYRALDDIAFRQLNLRRYKTAETSYQGVLRLLDAQITLGRAVHGKAKASVLHQLGIVAQAQRQWGQAAGYYQQALALWVEFNARFEQASTYHQLGMVAQEQRQWEQARDYLLKDLTITAEFQDEHGMGITLRSLARLWQASQDVGLPAGYRGDIGEHAGGSGNAALYVACR